MAITVRLIPVSLGTKHPGFWPNPQYVADLCATVKIVSDQFGNEEVKPSKSGQPISEDAFSF